MTRDRVRLVLARSTRTRGRPAPCPVDAVDLDGASGGLVVMVMVRWTVQPVAASNSNSVSRETDATAVHAKNLHDGGGQVYRKDGWEVHEMRGLATVR